MKRNTFYLLTGIVILLEVVGVYLAALNRVPLVATIGIIAGIIVLYLARRHIDDIIEDERMLLITQKAALRTLQVFWTIFFALSVGGIAFGFGNLLGIPNRVPWHPPPPVPVDGASEFVPAHNFGFLGMAQIGLLCLMLFLYVGFHMYYAKKYGEWEDDEE